VADRSADFIEPLPAGGVSPEPQPPPAANPFSKYAGEKPSDNPFLKYVSRPQVEPSTSAGGLAASAARGMAPIAAGALTGAALGAPLAGVGAIPGAAAGAMAAGGANLAGDLYNLIARKVGWSQMETPQELTDRALDAIGIRRPSTKAEEFTEMGAGMLPFGVMPSSKMAETLGSALIEGDAKKADSFIRKAYETSVKPNTGQFKEASQQERYRYRTRQAIDSIISNRDRIEFADEAGNVVRGELPKTVGQFASAIQQAKDTLFKRWNLMATASGEKGATVDLKPIADELRKFADHPGIKTDASSVGDFARNWADKLEQEGSRSLLQSQESLAMLNKRIMAIYQNGNMNDATSLAVSELAANNLRRALDAAVTSTEGLGYQALRHEYTSLRAIENDVVRRAQNVANKNVGGGIVSNMFDVYTGAEMAQAILTLHAAPAVRAATMAGARAIYRRMNDPDRLVEKIFERAERYHPDSIGQGTGKGGVLTGMQPPRPGNFAGGPPPVPSPPFVGAAP
jgi:hypothetical protein